MDENSYYALFGVEPRNADAEGGKEPAVTEPAQSVGSSAGAESEARETDPRASVAAGAAARNDREEEGASARNDGERADEGDGSGKAPAGDESKAGGEAASGTESGAEASADADLRGRSKGQQTPEENARYAAARRKAEAERDAAIEAAKRDAEARAQEIFRQKLAGAGLVDPFTQKPITTEAELDAYRSEYEKRARSEMMRRAGISDEELQKFIDGLPEVAEARAEKAQAAAAKKAAQDAEALAELDRQIAEIGKLDPRIRSFEDLEKLETYPALYEKVMRGSSVLDAFIVVNHEALVRSAAEAARQQARNAAEGKSHMTRTVARGQGAVEVPADVMAEYRSFNPGATDEEIRAHYGKYHRKS